MKNIVSGVILSFLFGLPALSWAEENGVQDKPAEYFFYRCAGCHTVGGGKLTGPDLLTSTQWAEADLESAVKKMEKNVGPISAEDLRMIVEFLKDPAVSERIAAQKQRIEAKMRAELPPPSFEKGENLFRGKKTLFNGGPACYSCHSFNGSGGSLGPDLTAIKERASGVVLQSSIENANYKLMRTLYEKKKITKEEAAHLTEYLSHPEKSRKVFVFGMQNVVSLAGLFASVFIGLLWFLNSRKKARAHDILFKKSRGGDR